jgi:1-acyl-sn-glycerol-3-phosphate acyltransferase
VSDVVLHETPILHAPSTFVRIAKQAPFDDAGHGYDRFGLHPPTLARVLKACAPIYERYFRVVSDGIEHVPTKGPAILVANHGGMLPVDAAMLCIDVLRRLEPPRIPRAITDHFVPRLPLVGTLFARSGVVNGTRTNVRHLLDGGELIAIWPEGVTGPAKRFRDRYRIQSWSVGFAELAIRHRAPVVPVAIVGSEESWPLAAKLGVRLFGAPYLPVPAWPVPLPAHYRIQYGSPIHLDRDHLAAEADDPAIVAAAAARVRGVIERQIDDLRIARRGVFR